jgi:hypothetical protein
MNWRKIELNVFKAGPPFWDPVLRNKPRMYTNSVCVVTCHITALRLVCMSFQFYLGETYHIYIAFWILD